MRTFFRLLPTLIVFVSWAIVQSKVVGLEGKDALRIFVVLNIFYIFMPIAPYVDFFGKKIPKDFFIALFVSMLASVYLLMILFGVVFWSGFRLD